MAADDKQVSWWQTVPGVITGVGTLLGALTGLIIALNQAGVLRGPSAVPTAASTVSTPPVAPMKTATLPSVTGVPLADARQVLRSLGFTDIRAVRKFSGAVPGTVIEQVPNPRTNLPLDQLVNLMVATRPPAPPASAGPALQNEAGGLLVRFEGTWLNVEAKPGELTKVVIQPMSDQIAKVYDFGPGNSNWGEFSARLQGADLVFSNSKATTRFHLRGSNLIIDSVFNVPDNLKNRPDFAPHLVFRKTTG